MTTLSARLHASRRIAIGEDRDGDTAVPVGIGAPVAPAFHIHSVRLCDELNHAASVYARHQGVTVECVMAEALRHYLGLAQ